MTTRDGNLVLEIDRDDAMADWLSMELFRKQHLSYTSKELFIEFSVTDAGCKIVAGIDYESSDDSIGDLTTQRHRLMCDSLDIPYFYVIINGRKYVKDGICLAKQINYYAIDEKKCNLLAVKKLHSLGVPKLMTEEDYSAFLHRLRGLRPVPVHLDNEIYLANSSFQRIFREQHAKYGKALLQSDMDLVLYSKSSVYSPVMIIEFKANKQFHNIVMNPGTAQYKMHSSLGKKLNIPVYRIWHPDGEIDRYVVVGEYNKNTYWQNYFSSIELSGKELVRDLCHIIDKY